MSSSRRSHKNTHRAIVKSFERSSLLSVYSLPRFLSSQHLSSFFSLPFCSLSPLEITVCSVESALERSLRSCKFARICRFVVLTSGGLRLFRGLSENYPTVGKQKSETGKVWKSTCKRVREEKKTVGKLQETKPTIRFSRGKTTRLSWLSGGGTGSRRWYT